MTGSTPADRGRASWPRRVRALLAEMSLEQKTEQIAAIVLPPPDQIAEDGPGAGVVFVPVSAPDAPERIAAFERAMQRRAEVGGTRPIPALPLALGPDTAGRFLPRLGRLATWDLRLIERMAASNARSLRSVGLYGHLVPAGSAAGVGAPVRADPLLAATFQTARIHGAQGRSSGRVNSIGPGHVALVVPFGVFPDGQWHERTLRTNLLVAAEAAVRAGAAIVVPSPAGNAGVPAHTDGWLLRDLLRHEWRFSGVVVAHPGAVDALDTTYRIAGDADEAIALALEAGVDVISAPTAARRLMEMVRRGALPTWLVDDAVAAVLACKLRLGLLGDPDTAPPEPSPPGAALAEQGIGSALARQVLTRSLVLLTDPAGVLPLDPAGIVDVVPGAVGSADVAALATALAAARAGGAVRAGPAPPGAEPAGTVVVVSARPEDAVPAAEAVVTSGRRCVVLVTSDRVDTLDALAATTATVLVCWRPLARHADILADVLTGRTEPGGRLPLALTRDDAVPSSPGVTFPLGHGGGYTTFDYSRLVISPAVLDGGDVVRVQCWVTNTGSRPGREVVQAYLDNPTGRSVVTRGPSLAAFSTVEVPAGQTLPVTIRLPLHRLAVWNRSMQQILEPGTIDVLVGRSAGDIRLRGTVRIAAHPSRWRAGGP